MKYLNSFHFLFILSFALIFHAQDSQVDSLKAILENSKDDTLKVNLLNTLAVNVYRSDPEEAIKYGSEAKDLAEQIDFRKGLAYAFKSIGLGYYIQGNFVEAIIT